MRYRTDNPVVFGYNFPHKKTQDFLQRLVLNGYSPSLVLLADRVKLKGRDAGPRVKPRHCDLVHPRLICERFGIRSEVVDHASEGCVALLRKQQPVLGIVAGARILPHEVIDCFSLGILNFHPGLIPEIRGLDALQWALHLDMPLGVTSHLIDHRVDAGRIIERRTIEEFADDTMIDLSLRLYETQIQMLSSTMDVLSRQDLSSLQTVQGGQYRSSLPAPFAASLKVKLSQRLSRLNKAA